MREEGKIGGGGKMDGRGNQGKLGRVNLESQKYFVYPSQNHSSSNKIAELTYKLLQKTQVTA